MKRRATAAVCLVFGLLLTPGVASADSMWTVPVPVVPGGWGAQHDKGDGCRHRGEPPCHPTTTTAMSGTSATATTTTTAVSGTSATATTTNVTTTVPTTVSTTTVPTASSTTAGVSVPAAAPPAPPRRVASSSNALADTGVTTGWVPTGLAALFAGGLLLVIAARRRA